MKRSRWVAGAAAMIAALIGATVPVQADFGSGALGNWPTLAHSVTDDWATADVGLIGDSITARCHTALAAQLASRGKTLAVNYWSGRPTRPAVDWLLAQPRLPKILLVATGANDIFDPRPFGAQVARLKANLPAGVTLMWVDVQAARTHYGAAVQLADQRNSMWIDNQLRENLAKGQIIAWSEWFASDPSRLAYYLEDGIHPWTTAGRGHGDGCAFWAGVIMSGASVLRQ